MKILITGVAGFIGSCIAKDFILKGHDIYGVDDLSNGKFSNIPKGLEFIKGDLSNKKIIKHLPNKCDYILHLAGQSSG
jgi:nucleoside-diphosphate-sugar epimerase